MSSHPAKAASMSEPAQAGMSEQTDRDETSAQPVAGRGDRLDALARVAADVVVAGGSLVSPRVSESFPKECRILHRSEFLRIQGQGHRIHGARLIFQFLPGRTPRSRLGLTVSKKVGNAVVRNRIKRWLREAFRRHPELRPDRPARGQPSKAYDLVITAKRGIEDFGFAVLHAEVVDVLGRYLDGRFDRRRAGGRDGKGPRAEPTGGDRSGARGGGQRAPAKSNRPGPARD